MPAYHMTPAEADELLDEHRRLLTRDQRRDRKEKDFKDTAFQLVEVNALAFGFGFVRGKWGGEVFKIPADLASGVVLHAAGFFGGRRWGHHFHNLGDGALASYFTTLGSSVGADGSKPATAHAGASPLLLPAGNQNPTKGPLSERELVSLIQSTVARAPTAAP